MLNFEWDPVKARRNLAKHGVAFDDAQAVWNDPLHIVAPDRFEDGEQRWHATGMAGAVTILVVVYTCRGRDDETVLRIISARKATPHERRRYEQERT